MAVFRVEKIKGYTIMSNHHLKDQGLSLKAKGLLSLVLSLPESWDYTVRGLAAICKEGVECIGSTIKELERAGYIIRRQLRDSQGRMSDVEYTIYEKPHPPVEPQPGEPSPAPPCTENPDTVTSDTVFPATENPPQYNTNQVIPKKEKIKSSRTDSSINPSMAIPPDRMDEMRAYRSLIMDNIEYDILADQYGHDRMDEVVELMLETVCSKRQYIRVAGDEFPLEVVKSRLLKLNSSHVEYALDCIDKNTTKVRNIKSYLLTTLYNAPATMDSYYRAEVAYDLYGG